MPHLFEPLELRSARLRNRIGMSPMCMYSTPGGVPREWHRVHLGSRAVGGCGAVFTEATAVEPAGRISPADTGIWNAEQVEAWRPVAAFIREQGALAGMQLAHAGRKASTAVPAEGGMPLIDERGWEVLSSSALPFAEGYPVPHALSEPELEGQEKAWAAAARNAFAAGFQAVELHFAHGYLLHQFLSPLANRRTDSYGGSLERRMAFPLKVARAVRQAWSEELPLFVRVSTTDWAEGGWELSDTIALCVELKRIGVDLIDCSSGGIAPGIKVPAAPGYQVPFAEAIRREAGIATAALGLITAPAQAEEIVAGGSADMVMLGRQLLRETYWPLRAAKELGYSDAPWPAQYLRAKT